MTHHVFLSYSRRDSDVMERVYEDLCNAGLTVWTDRGIEPGTRSWRDAIENAILDAGCVVCILSPDANDSKWVRAELEFTDLQQKPLYILLARGDERSSIPFGFAAFQWSDIRDESRYSVQLADLVETIKKKLNVIPAKIEEGANTVPSSVTVDAPFSIPFEWCAIDSAFSISKYPITNEQYQLFLSTGYSEVKWWDFSDEARKFRLMHPKPKSIAFNGEMLPRTNVSWFDAVAFSRWLGAQLNKNVSLPTEEQWQKAAQGDDVRLYPWGNDDDIVNCNLSPRVLTPVTRFPSGSSPYGVMDMVGNAWEWCLNIWGSGNTDLTGSSDRVLKGGYWFSNDFGHDYRLTIRDQRPPETQEEFIGFRCVLSGG